MIMAPNDSQKKNHNYLNIYLLTVKQLNCWFAVVLISKIMGLSKVLEVEFLTVRVINSKCCLRILKIPTLFTNCKKILPSGLRLYPWQLLNWYSTTRRSKIQQLWVDSNNCTSSWKIYKTTSTTPFSYTGSQGSAKPPLPLKQPHIYCRDRYSIYTILSIFSESKIGTCLEINSTRSPA